jgi:hypothetical protein
MAFTALPLSMHSVYYRGKQRQELPSQSLWAYWLAPLTLITINTHDFLPVVLTTQFKRLARWCHLVEQHCIVGEAPDLTFDLAVL